MKGRAFLQILLILCLLLSGCNATIENIKPKAKHTQYFEKEFSVNQTLNLNLDCESADIEVYVWNKNIVKFEVTKIIRGVQQDKELEEELNAFDIQIEQEKNKILFYSKYNGKKTSPVDHSIGLKIFIPKRINDFTGKLDIGTVKFMDDLRCDLNLDIQMANVTMKHFEGKLNFNAEMGNLRIENGKINSSSKVMIQYGNIDLKSELEAKGDMRFETNVGNIDLAIPDYSQFNIESIGTLEVNDFQVSNASAKIRLISGMGSIKILKY